MPYYINSKQDGVALPFLSCIRDTSSKSRTSNWPYWLWTFVIFSSCSRRECWPRTLGTNSYHSRSPIISFDTIQSGHKVPLQLLLTNPQDLKTAVGDSFYNIQPSTWKKMSEITWKRINAQRMDSNIHTCSNVTARYLCALCIILKLIQRYKITEKNKEYPFIGAAYSVLRLYETG
jgi:hypothetical protein